MLTVRRSAGATLNSYSLRKKRSAVAERMESDCWTRSLRVLPVSAGGTLGEERNGPPDITEERLRHFTDRSLAKSYGRGAPCKSKCACFRVLE